MHRTIHLRDLIFQNENLNLQLMEIVCTLNFWCLMPQSIIYCVVQETIPISKLMEHKSYLYESLHYFCSHFILNIYHKLTIESFCVHKVVSALYLLYTLGYTLLSYTISVTKHSAVHLCRSIRKRNVWRNVHEFFIRFNWKSRIFRLIRLKTHALYAWKGKNHIYACQAYTK